MSYILVSLKIIGYPSENAYDPLGFKNILFIIPKFKQANIMFAKVVYFRVLRLGLEFIHDYLILLANIFFNRIH